MKYNGINVDEEIDVREMIPLKRHELLGDLFGAIPVGVSFVFINDHDPVPLYYELKSIYGDVIDWAYIHRGGREWKVKVTRTDDSKARDIGDASAVIDLTQTDPKSWKQVVFHRYGMMEEGTSLQLVSREDPVEIKEIFAGKFAGKHQWEYRKEVPGQYVIHIEKQNRAGLDHDGFSVVNEFDVRPYPPAERHEIFYKAFDELQPGEAFEFINDHDPSPLYYQMKAESKEPFQWDYLEKGPEAWKVRVIKVKQ